MTPIKFPQQNRTFGKGQGLIPLPAHIDQDGVVTTLWKTTSWKERVRFLFTGKMWFNALTYNMPLQSQRPTLECPLIEAEDPEFPLIVPGSKA